LLENRAKILAKQSRPGVEKPGGALECGRRFLYIPGMIPDRIVTRFD
jgi:hypothetical protein